MLTNRQQEIYELMLRNVSNEQIAKKLDIRYATVRSHKKAINRWIRNNSTADIPILPVIENEFSTDFKEETGKVTSKSVNLKTVEDVINFAEIDTDEWEVVQVKTKSWDMPRKNKEIDLEYVDGKKTGTVKDHGGFHVQTMYGIDVWFKRKVTDPVLEGLKNIIEDLRINPPKLTKTTHTELKDYLLEISLVDHHFGKLCIDGSGTERSDKVYSLAVDNILAKTGGYNISKIVLPLGSDFFHINNMNGQTRKGTYVDTDKSLFDIFEVGQKAVINAVYKLREVAPVEILWVPGNHDYETSFYLCNVINAWFRQDKHISVDLLKIPRKYCKHGSSLIGYTHGNEEKIADLPLLMMSENRKRLAEIDYFEWHIGHVHKKKEMKFVAGDTIGHIPVKTLPSLSGTDYWHLQKGYTGIKATESYLYSYYDGPTGYFTCNLKEIGF